MSLKVMIYGSPIFDSFILSLCIYQNRAILFDARNIYWAAQKARFESCMNSLYEI